MEAVSSMIVQIRLSAGWGTDDEIAERDEIGESVGAELQRRGWGYFDGRDTGGGATNLFFCGIPESAWGDAVEVALDELRRRHALKRAVIAKSILIEKEPDPEVEHVVVWPTDFSGSFDIFGWSGGGV